MIYENAVLIDSDAFVGLQIKQDEHHPRAKELFRQIRHHQIRPVVTNYVIAETTNLLSRRYSMTDAKRFLKLASHLPVIIIDEPTHQESVQLFHQQTRTKTSMIDLSNVVVMKRFSIPQIFSFDKVYSKDFSIRMISVNK